jgi:hypothetical protein
MSDIALPILGADGRIFEGIVTTENGGWAGRCFASAQGGVFSSPLTKRLVVFVRELGLTGVGQSSWGPMVFICRSESAAIRLEQIVRSCPEFARVQSTTRSPPIAVPWSRSLNKQAGVKCRQTGHLVLLR